MILHRADNSELSRMNVQRAVHGEYLIQAEVQEVSRFLHGIFIKRDSNILDF